MIMDPLTVIGLASNIISFINFSSKLVKIALEATRLGSTKDLDNTINIIGSLESTLQSFKQLQFLLLLPRIIRSREKSQGIR